MKIYIVAKGFFGKPEAIVKPGERYNVGIRRFGKIYLEKVDSLTGNATKDGLNLSLGILKEF